MTKILTCYYRPKPGGFCKRLFRAIDALLAAGHEVHYLAVQPFPIQHTRCHFHRFPWPQNRTSNLAFWVALHLVAPLILLYLSVRHRITHLFAFGTNYGFMFQLSRLVKRIPLTVFLRSDVLETHKLNRRPRWLIAADFFVEAVAIVGVRLFAVSHNLLDVTLRRHRFARPRATGVLPNDLPTISGGIATPARAAQTPIRLACIGVIEPLKNQAVVVEALASIGADVAQLYVYGDGPQRRSLELRCKNLGLQDHVHFLGWIDEPGRLWENIDLLLSPSLLEGSPNAVLESVSRGIPVLASDIAAHREILPDSALVSARDPCDWTHMIQTIVSAPAVQLEQFRREQERTTARLRFDWNGRISALIASAP